MKIINETELIRKGSFSEGEEISLILKEIRTAIKYVVWPEGSKIFTINPGKHVNGVVPIKENFFSYLRSKGWQIEHSVYVGATRSRPGKIDATRETRDGKLFAVEWETGNISSSHRALNKITIGIMNNVLVGGALILPSDNLYPYLTDRVGNIGELEPYFAVWRNVKIDEGYLCTISVEHDEVSEDVPPIRKGTDGRALV